jgi:hypothetical protein
MPDTLTTPAESAEPEATYKTTIVLDPSVLVHSTFEAEVPHLEIISGKLKKSLECLPDKISEVKNRLDIDELKRMYRFEDYDLAKLVKAGDPMNATKKRLENYLAEEQWQFKLKESKVQQLREDQESSCKNMRLVPPDDPDLVVNDVMRSTFTKLFDDFNMYELLNNNKFLIFFNEHLEGGDFKSLLEELSKLHTKESLLQYLKWKGVAEDEEAATAEDEEVVAAEDKRALILALIQQGDFNIHFHLIGAFDEFLKSQGVFLNANGSKSEFQLKKHGENPNLITIVFTKDKLTKAKAEETSALEDQFNVKSLTSSITKAQYKVEFNLDLSDYTFSLGEVSCTLEGEGDLQESLLKKLKYCFFKQKHFLDKDFIETKQELVTEELRTTEPKPPEQMAEESTQQRDKLYTIRSAKIARVEEAVMDLRFSAITRFSELQQKEHVKDRTEEERKAFNAKINDDMKKINTFCDAALAALTRVPTKYTPADKNPIAKLEKALEEVTPVLEKHRSLKPKVYEVLVGLFTLGILHGLKSLARKFGFAKRYSLFNHKTHTLQSAERLQAAVTDARPYCNYPVVSASAPAIKAR